MRRRAAEVVTLHSRFDSCPHPQLVLLEGTDGTGGENETSEYERRNARSRYVSEAVKRDLYSSFAAAGRDGHFSCVTACDCGRLELSSRGSVSVMSVELYQGDCLEVMPAIPDGAVDMILCDLPYGTTACKWDTVIPFEPLWTQYKRLIKRNGAIVLFGSQPFTSALVMSNPTMFRYCWVWEKSRATNFLDCKKKPLKKHEDICVFYSNQPTYNPNMVKGAAHSRGGASPGPAHVWGKFNDRKETGSDEYYPLSIIQFASEMVPMHPTQKPVALMEYLIRTYTNEGETVLDNTMGSGTTGVACVNTGRNFIGIEKDAGYFEIAQQRIEQALRTERQMQMLLEAAV
jgi:site-specific DNA-methyltransferase (adenine-specific)